MSNQSGKGYIHNIPVASAEAAAYLTTIPPSTKPGDLYATDDDGPNALHVVTAIDGATGVPTLVDLTAVAPAP